MDILALIKAAQQLQSACDERATRARAMSALAAEARRTGVSQSHRITNDSTVFDLGDIARQITSALNSKRANEFEQMVFASYACSVITEGRAMALLDLNRLDFRDAFHRWQRKQDLNGNLRSWSND